MVTRSSKGCGNECTENRCALHFVNRLMLDSGVRAGEHGDKFTVGQTWKLLNFCDPSLFTVKCDSADMFSVSVNVLAFCSYYSLYVQS